MRAYWNNTNTPIQYKTWIINSREVTENNLKFLKGYEVTARLVMDYETFDAYGTTQRYAKGGTAEFLTTCKEQESVLQLLYGNKLMLKTVDVVLPNTVTYSS